MAKECCVHFFKYGSSLHTRNAAVFITFNIKIYNISNNKMKKVILWEFHMLYYLSISQNNGL